MSSVRESYFFETLHPEEHENLEDITIVWFDKNVEQSDDCLDFQSRIRRIINYLIVFNDCISCKDYLFSIEQEKIFLIVSGVDGESLVNLVHHLSKVQSIYVFCYDKNRHEDWSKTYSKIRGVYTSKDKLLQTLKNDAYICLLEILPMRALGIKAMQKTIKELNEEGGLFIWSHLLIHILRHMKHDENAKNELLTLSRQQYVRNDQELEKISDFELNYTPEKAIWWYTKDSFLYRLLNKALRTENFDVIYKFRSFIADLHQQLTSMHHDYQKQIFSSDNDQVFTVYRGQRLAKPEFEKLKENINGFISMNTFLSTTTRSTVALMYSGNGEGRPLFESVLFEIVVEKCDSTEPFADIGQVSFFQNENEILFTIGTIFRIDAIDDLTPTVSVIQLSLVKHSDEERGKLTQYLNQSISSKPTIRDLNDIFLQIDDYPRVVRYTQVLLAQSGISDLDRARAYITLGDAELHISGNYTKAEKLFLDAQQIVLTSLPCNYDILAQFYDSMGFLQVEKNNYTAAVESFNQILQIKDHVFESKFIILRTHSNLGLAYRKAMRFDQACESYEKALTALEQMDEVPKLHPFHPVIHNNLAYTKQLQYKYDEALKHYNLALELERKSLPSNHSIIATTLNNIGLLHMMKGEDNQALIIHEKVAVMLSEIYGPEHPRLGVIFHNLGDLCIRVEKYEQAKEYLNKALHIRSNNTTVDLDDLASTWTSLGLMHCLMKSFNNSLRCCYEALHIRSKLPLTKTNNIGDTYLILSRYHLAKFDYSLALLYCELAQYRCQSHGMKLSAVHEQFGDVLYPMGQFDEAISHYQMSIDMQLQLTNQINDRVFKLYNVIGTIHASKGEYDEALRYFAQVRELAQGNFDFIVTAHLATAETYIGLKRFDRVVEHLELADSILDKIVPAKRIHTARRLRIIGDMHYQKHSFDYAIKNLTDALTIYKEELPEFYPIVCDTYLKLGLALEKRNKIDEALEIFEKVKTISVTIYPKSCFLIAPCYHRVSIILRDKNRLEESLDNAKHALNAAMIAKPMNFRELSGIYDTLSRIYIKREDFTQAHIEAQNGSNIRQIHCPHNLVLSEITLALIYIHENRSQEATDLLDKITDDQLFSVQSYTPARLGKDIALLYNNLQQRQSALKKIEFALNHIAENEHYLGADAHVLAAQICWTLGHKSQTLEHFHQALEMLDDSTNEQYRETIIYIYQNITKIYKSLNDYHSALQSYKQMLRFGSSNELPQIHLDIGICQVELGDIDLSLESFELVRSLCSSTDYDLLANVHYELGRYYARKENGAEALKHFETAVDMRPLCTKPDDSQLDSLYLDMGQLYVMDNRFQEAAKFFELLIERQLEQDDLEGTLQTLRFLGFTYIQLENIDKSIRYYQLALQLCLSRPLLNHEAAANIYSQLGEAYDLDCNVWKCAESYEKALEMALMMEPPDDEFLTTVRENIEVARQNVIKIEKKLFEEAVNTVEKVQDQ